MEQERENYAEPRRPLWWVWEFLAVLLVAVGVAVAVVLYFSDSESVPPAQPNTVAE